MSDAERMTRVCSRMAETWLADHEKGDERIVIVMASTTAEGLQMHGYEPGMEYAAVLDVLSALAAVAGEIGISMDVSAAGGGDDDDVTYH